MKKSILIIISVLFCVSCFAQKKYLLLCGDMRYLPNASSTLRNYAYLSGDIPAGFKTEYLTSGPSGETTVGELLNRLVDEGFIVEQYTAVGNTGCDVSILLSHSATNEDDAISVIHNDDGDVREVARYNLQGMQVNENEKGIQIIVYSNYTTKTVIVE